MTFIEGEIKMDIKATVLDILNDLTGNDVSGAMDDNLFDSGIMDSMASVQLLLSLQSELGVNVPVSEFERSEWDTPNKIIAKVETLA
jgi:D-alanine--poly(phosphoribitol) ligase subunit 2